VEENLGKLLELPKKDMSALSGFWQDSLAPEIQRAVALLFAELEKLRESMGARA
jgi:hypothetical protein